MNEITVERKEVNECEVASNAELPPGLSKEEIEKLKRQQEKAKQLAEGEQPKEAEQPVE